MTSTLVEIVETAQVAQVVEITLVKKIKSQEISSISCNLNQYQRHRDTKQFGCDDSHKNGDCPGILTVQVSDIPGMVTVPEIGTILGMVTVLDIVTAVGMVILIVC